MHNFKRRFASAAFGLFANGCLLLSTSLRAAPPRYDHVVIVVEENRTVEQIVGDLVNAPYITSLATGVPSVQGCTHCAPPSFGACDCAVTRSHKTTAARESSSITIARMFGVASY